MEVLSSGVATYVLRGRGRGVASELRREVRHDACVRQRRAHLRVILGGASELGDRDGRGGHVPYGRRALQAAHQGSCRVHTSLRCGRLLPELHTQGDVDVVLDSRDIYPAVWTRFDIGMQPVIKDNFNRFSPVQSVH
jgi:hypothetical protein